MDADATTRPPTPEPSEATQVRIAEALERIAEVLEWFQFRELRR